MFPARFQPTNGMDDFLPFIPEKNFLFYGSFISAKSESVFRRKFTFKFLNLN